MGELIERPTFLVGALRLSQKFDQMLDLMCKVPVVLVKICLDEIIMCRSILLVTVGRAVVSLLKRVAKCYNKRQRQTFCDMGNVYVFYITSICIHGEELLRQLAFHQKYRRSHNETDVRHI